MAGPKSRRVELGEGSGSLYVRFLGYSNDRPLYQWAAKNGEGRPVAAGMDVSLGAGDKPDSRQALLVVVDHMRAAGRQFAEEQQSGQRADLHSEMPSEGGAWAMANDAALVMASESLRTELGVNL